MTRFWIGGYSADMAGEATGIGVLEGDEGREPVSLAYRGVVASAASPSWLAQHPSLDVVYAALESTGTVQAYSPRGERELSPLGEPVEAGDSVCHLAVAPSGSSLIASCYGDGRVVRIGIDADGSLRAPTVADAAVDPYASDSLALAAPVDGADAAASADRASHAHAAAFLPDGRLATTDLGFDLVRFWRRGASGPVADHSVVLPFGVGPRHMVVHPSGHLHVVTEYSCEVFTLAPRADGQWAIVGATTVSPAAQLGVDNPAELSRSRDGETLYAGVRGSNTIAALRVRGGGETIEPLALADSGVNWPRHHLVHDGALLVAGQLSNEISVIDLDERTGVPRSIRHRASVPAPTCILLAR